MDRFRHERDRIDLVILDLTMPRLSGQATLHELCRIDPAVKVLFSSGYSVDQIDPADMHKVCGFVIKPYAPEELLSNVRQALEGSGAG